MKYDGICGSDVKGGREGRRANGEEIRVVLASFTIRVRMYGPLSAYESNPPPPHRMERVFVIVTSLYFFFTLRKLEKLLQLANSSKNGEIMELETGE